MKKFSFILVAALLSAGIFAQSDKYTSAMQPKVVAIDTTYDIAALNDLANAFVRIGDAEKTQWLPYYYAAYATVKAGNSVMTSTGMQGGAADKLDPYAEKAEGFLSKAEALTKDNSEIFVIKKMIATLRMMGDPQSRYMTYGPPAAEALATAKKLNPNNPRVYLLEGIDKFYTPVEYGGSKDEAKKLFEESLKKFENKPESAIHPNWGKGQVEYFMGQMK